MKRRSSGKYRMRLNRRTVVALVALTQTALLVVVGCLSRGGKTETESSRSSAQSRSDGKSGGHSRETSAAAAPASDSAADSASDGAHSSVSAESGQQIRIGAWNIEWLGSPESRSGPAKHIAQKPEALADYIKAGHVAVLAVEECAVTEESPMLQNETLRAALNQINQQTGSRWSHRLFPARSGRNQNVGVCWDARAVTPIGEPILVTPAEGESSQGKPLWSRPAWAQKFSAGDGLTDFYVIPMHLKSDYQGKFDAHRAEEARELIAQLPQRISDGDHDIIIAGDSNADTHNEPAVEALVGAGFVDLNARDTSTHVRYGALDRIFVPADQPEFKGRVFEVLSENYRSAKGLSSEAFKKYYSDHFMVITTIVVMPDDD